MSQHACRAPANLTNERLERGPRDGHVNDAIPESLQREDEARGVVQGEVVIVWTS